MDRLQQLEDDLLSTIDNLEKLIDPVSDSLSDYDNLEESKKVVLAECVNNQDQTFSEKKKESLSLAGLEYKNHLNALYESNKLKLRKKLMFDILSLKVKALISIYSAENKARFVDKI